MKTIGFADYYISEWHANNYPAWIKAACEKIGEDIEVKYVWAEISTSPLDGVTTEEWCKKYCAEQCSSISELCEKADYICILAPSNPEKHLSYAKEVLKYGKNTYIDKVFAPDYATAAEIFDIAKKYGTKFFSTSALRYAKELEAVEGACNLKTTGSGSNFEEYIVHQAEMVIKTLRTSIDKVRVDSEDGIQYDCRVLLADGKAASLGFSANLPYAIGDVDVADELISIKSNYFTAFIEDMIRFYITGDVSFDIAETLEVMKLCEALIKAKNNLGEWIKT